MGKDCATLVIFEHWLPILLFALWLPADHEGLPGQQPRTLAGFPHTGAWPLLPSSFPREITAKARTTSRPPAATAAETRSLILLQVAGRAGSARRPGRIYTGSCRERQDPQSEQNSGNRKFHSHYIQCCTDEPRGSVSKSAMRMPMPYPCNGFKPLPRPQPIAIATI